MADSERPSPFTIPEPSFRFAEGQPSEHRLSRSMTVGGLIHNLTVFADFYERASADIDREESVTKPWYIGNRDANADAMQRDFRATVAIDRVRAYVLANYGADLTIGTARRLLGDLIRTCGLAVDGAEALPLEAAMDKLDAAGSRRGDANRLDARGARAANERAVPSESLRTPAQLLEAFAGAAARFPACPRMVAFLNSAREDGLVTVPPSFVPRKEDGQPVVGQLNIGGTSKTVFGHGATFYGIGGARMTTERGGLNVGFVLYGVGNDDAATKFRELGNEAGVVVHVHDLVRGIQTYDRPLVLWSLIVYETLQGSEWLSRIDGIAENPALHFNPFTASVEALKRLLARNESLIERLLAGPDDVEPSLREMALLEARLRQPVSFAAIQHEKKASGHSPTEAARNKLKLIRDFNRGLRGQGDADESEKQEAPAPAVALDPAPKRSTERGEGRTKLIAALTKHHQYADGGCLNLEPIGNNELAKAAGVSASTASAFFNDKFQGHTKYKALCRDAGKLTAALKLLNDEFAPYHLLGAASSDLAAPGQDDVVSE